MRLFRGMIKLLQTRKLELCRLRKWANLMTLRSTIEGLLLRPTEETQGRNLIGIRYAEGLFVQRLRLSDRIVAA